MDTSHIVLITGASTGIGYACTKMLKAEGFDVIGGVRTQADADRLKAEIGCRTVLIDVTDGAQVDTARESLLPTTEGQTFSLVNNAGIAVGGPLECIPLEDFDRQFAVNVTGLLRVTQAFLPAIRQSRGRIVNMSSIAGRIAMPFIGPYSASKHAVEAISDNLRRELAPTGVKVASVNPGTIRTPIWDKSTTPIKTAFSGELSAEAQVYAPQIAKLDKVMDKIMDDAVPPEDVAAAVLHALTADRPRTRYFVGKGTSQKALLARLLPDRLIDRVAVSRFKD